jgi:hypothetical protein
VRILVRNTGKKPAYPVRLMLAPDTCSVLWTDNYFWLRSGETRVVSGTVRMDMTGIDNVGAPTKAKLADLRVTVSAWNTAEPLLLTMAPRQ